MFPASKEFSPQAGRRSVQPFLAHPFHVTDWQTPGSSTAVVHISGNRCGQKNCQEKRITDWQMKLGNDKHRDQCLTGWFNQQISSMHDLKLLFYVLCGRLRQRISTPSHCNYSEWVICFAVCAECPVGLLLSMVSPASSIVFWWCWMAAVFSHRCKLHLTDSYLLWQGAKTSVLVSCLIFGVRRQTASFSSKKTIMSVCLSHGWSTAKRFELTK